MGAAQTMIDRTEERLGLKPDRLVADTAHGSAENPAWLTRQRSIIPFIPLIDKSERKDGAFSRSDFKWDEDNDRYICPEGKHLLQSRRNYSDPRRKNPKPVGAGTGPPKLCAMSAPQNQNAAQIQKPVSSVAKNMKMHVILHGWPQRLISTRKHKLGARRARGRLHISNASLAAGASGSQGHAAPATNLHLLPSPRTSENSQSSDLRPPKQG